MLDGDLHYSNIQSCAASSHYLPLIVSVLESRFFKAQHKEELGTPLSMCHNSIFRMSRVGIIFSQTPVSICGSARSLLLIFSFSCQPLVPAKKGMNYHHKFQLLKEPCSIDQSSILTTVIIGSPHHRPAVI